MSNFAWICVLAGAILWGCSASYYAYRTGVADGFGYAWEPSNQRYHKAGRWLKKRMGYRWIQLKNPSYAAPYVEISDG